MRVVDIELASVIIEPRQERSVGDLSGLMASIEDVGLLHPIVVGTDHKLKVGYRRLMAFRQMERDTIPAHLSDDLNDVIQALKAERDENVQRESLPWTVMVARGKELEALVKTPVGRPSVEIMENSHNLKPGTTRDKVGEVFGVSGTTWEHAKQVVEAAESDPEIFGDLPERMDVNTSVDAAFKEMKRREKKGKPHVSHSSGNNEWYTPSKYIAAAYDVMGSIDLDPASSGLANETVKAETYYTAEDDGLAQEWAGRVWMNPPYASGLIDLFAEKLAKHVNAGDVTEACVLVNNATETGWFNALLDVATCVCLIKTRVKFIDIDGRPSGAPLQGQVVLYIGENETRFAAGFGHFGRVLYARCDSE